MKLAMCHRACSVLKFFNIILFELLSPRLPILCFNPAQAKATTGDGSFDKVNNAEELAGFVSKLFVICRSREISLRHCCFLDQTSLLFGNVSAFV